MKTKANMMLVVGGIVILALSLVAGVALYWKIGVLGKAKTGLDNSRKLLDSVYSRDPFPSEKNVEKLRENRDDLRKEALSLSSSMGAGQIEPDTGKQPLEWVTMLKNIQKTLQAAANARGIATPKNFSFGFERYDEGTPPAVGHVPRLGMQLKIIEGLCSILFDAKIDEIKSVEREVFEMPQPSPMDGRRSQFPEVYDFEHVGLEFLARELTFIQVLDRFASNSMFIVVTDVKVEGESPRFEAGRESAEGPGAPAAPEEESDAEVYVSGPGREKPSKIRLELDVYRFLLKPGN